MGFESLKSWFKRKTDYDYTNQYRRYGYWVLIDGIRVADLSYVAEIDMGWTLYSIFIFNNKFSEIGLDRENWLKKGVTLENRNFQGYYIDVFLVGSILSDNSIALKQESIPLEKYIERCKGAVVV